ncbi:hypothetical protein [Amycolatopsis albispora]|uniref:DUF2637 domain-containing protein n=1 Tax=Amycolatopsis albispora TaxID=1804986 RepID=A0A344LB05_9PSEU|nr:hypothetical protein [Amycolatopsis albispora]AXB45229.1 hypothetical protein A4R43_24270 [Amycolatopsis albispora]
MTRRAAVSTRSGSDGAAVVQAVTVIMGVVVGLTFLFGFGNVLNLALRLGVPAWVAPLVAPAVDLSILGLLLGTRHLALTGASPEVLRPARRLLIFASVVTLALNVAEPLVAGEFGKAAFDAVGPLLLIGWSEVGPGLLQAIGATRPVHKRQDFHQTERQAPARSEASTDVAQARPKVDHVMRPGDQPPPSKRSPEALLVQARQEDAAHRTAHQRPISADTLRVRLGIGAAQARRLVKIIRAEFDAQPSSRRPSGNVGETRSVAAA